MLLLLFVFLTQGFSQVQLTQTRVKWKKSRGYRIIKTIICDAPGDNDAIFRNYRKGADGSDEWWLKFGDYRGRVTNEESAAQVGRASCRERV